MENLDKYGRSLVVAEKPIKTKKALQNRFAIAAERMKLLEDAVMNGKKLNLGCSQRKQCTNFWQVLGLKIYTLTSAAKEGLVLKDGEESLGKGYFESPISRYAELYGRWQLREDAEAAAQYLNGKNHKKKTESAE